MGDVFPVESIDETCKFSDNNRISGNFFPRREIGGGAGNFFSDSKLPAQIQAGLLLFSSMNKFANARRFN